MLTLSKGDNSRGDSHKQNIDRNTFYGAAVIFFSKALTEMGKALKKVM